MDSAVDHCGRRRSRASRELSTRNFATFHLEVDRPAALEEYNDSLGLTSLLRTLVAAFTELRVSDTKQLRERGSSIRCEIFISAKMSFDNLGCRLLREKNNSKGAFSM